MSRHSYIAQSILLLAVAISCTGGEVATGPEDVGGLNLPDVSIHKDGGGDAGHSDGGGEGDGTYPQGDGGPDAGSGGDQTYDAGPVDIGVTDGGEQDGGADAGIDAGPPPKLYAGFRASSYGIIPFPDEAYWDGVAHKMAAKFSGAAPGGVWVVGVIGGNNECMLNFPAPDKKYYPNATFQPSDDNEKYLAWFDAHGVHVWLQVEPGNADVAMLIKLVLDRYAAHPSVIGFGVDVEWLQSGTVTDGKAVTDNEATAWSAAVRGYDPAYTTYLKHWLPEKMPPTARQGLIFIDDSQQFADLSEMTAEFAVWGQTFHPAPVAFQIGYEADKKWWSTYPDPPSALGSEILSKVANAHGIFWVDFTLKDVFPP